MHIKRMNLKQMTIIAKLRVLPITKNLDVSHKRVKLEESTGIVTLLPATPGATGVEIMTGGYTGLVQDLVDNDNSQEDYCNGFELDKIEADFHSSSPVTWNNWRDEIIANRSTNPTVNKVSDLFAAWKM